ncbi:MAG: nucleotidyltransferase domain-containing protein [Dethiobacter sp.]|jgi:predicted nucleotidyltransferase|nr:nucleotidyltransferase domain-containing protein [Dethiobacter sp.]MBS3901133.1 nucleotidyltransferase domain-containing protein [Dethiobacter sp.]MBS3989075.1 nucleotidyltransferase domain-containing protein [Dethiobacter sp.]
MEPILGRDAIIRKAAGLLKQKPHVLFAYLFGSYATGKPHRSSDVDIAIYLRPGLDKMERFRQRLLLSDLLSDLIGMEVDLVDLAAAPLSLQHCILRQKILILEKDNKSRVHFEVASRREYFDLQRVLERRSVALINRASAGGAFYG